MIRLVNRYQALLFCFMFVFVPALQGCAGAVGALPEQAASPAMLDGQVLELSARSAVWGAQRAAEGAMHTFRMMSADGSKVLLAWPTVGTRWGFIGVDTAKQAGYAAHQLCGGGNLTTCGGMADLTAKLTESGWQFVTPDKLPPGLVVAITTAGGWLNTLASMPLLIAPGGAFSITDDVLEEFYQDDTVY